MKLKEMILKLKQSVSLLIKKFVGVIKCVTWGKVRPVLTRSISIFFLIICLYVIISPFYPAIEFKMKQIFEYDSDIESSIEKLKSEDEEVVNKAKKDLLESANNQAVYAKRRLLIPSIGVNINIVEGKSEENLSLGAWLRPNSSTPDKGSNTVITGHRYQYKPPNNRTFYNLDKVQVGDDLVIIWDDELYYYQVDDVFEVEADALEIEDPTDEPILTLYTCTPLWTAERRLVVRGRLISN